MKDYNNLDQSTMINATYNPKITSLYYPFSLPNEEFRQACRYITDLAEYYWISNWGRLYNAKTGFLVKPFYNFQGYEFYVLRRSKEARDSGKYPTYTIAGQILVCSCFNGVKPGPEYQVNHLDYKRTNNYYKNLEWTTPLENFRYSYDAGHFMNGNAFANAKYTDTQAIAVCELLQSGIYDYNEISMRIFGCPPNKSIHDFIRSIHIRRHWTHISKDYKFDDSMLRRNYTPDYIITGTFNYMVTHPDIAYTTSYRDILAYIGIDVNTLDYNTRIRYKSAINCLRRIDNSYNDIRSKFEGMYPPRPKRGTDPESGNSLDPDNN